MGEAVLPFLTGLALGLVVGMLFTGQKRRVTTARRNVGVEKINKERQIAKQSAKQQILDYFLRKQHISNKDVENILRVSDTTATNYLNEMMREKLITRHGVRGRGVFYTMNDKHVA